jgi:hypothetical protein
MSKFTVLALAACALLLGGCSVFSGLSTVKECNYTFAGLDNFSYAGVKLDKLKDPKSLTLTDSINILTALRDKNTKLTFNTLVDIENPHSGTASVEKMDWILFLDDVEMLSGINNDTIKVEPNATSRATIQANVDPTKVLNGNSLENLWTLYCKLSGRDTSKSTKVTLKLKPTVGGHTLKDYLTLDKTL